MHAFEVLQGVVLFTYTVGVAFGSLIINMACTIIQYYVLHCTGLYNTIYPLRFRMVLKSPCESSRRSNQQNNVISQSPP